jgi:hypothetical protein
MSAWADELPQSRYGVIVARNAFGLVDPPPPAAPAPPPAAPSAVQLNLQLAGISAGPSGTYAWLVAPPKPGGNTNTLYFKLKEWSPENPDEQGELKVLAINPRERTVKVENAGVVAVLELNKDSPVPTGPASVPGAPGASGGPVPTLAPGARPTRPVPGAAGPGGARVLAPTPGVTGRAGTASFPSASLRQPGETTVPTRVGTFNVGGGAGGLTAGTGGRVVPARPVRTSPEEQLPQDPAVQWLMIRAQEEAARGEGVAFPPTPPMFPGAE